MIQVRRASVLVALAQVVILGLVGAKFLVDRATYPRLWVRTVPFDPTLPIRGRYVRLNVVVEHSPPVEQDSQRPGANPFTWANLQVRDNRLVAVEAPDGRHHLSWRPCGQAHCWVLSEPIAYFIPEHVKDPSIREPGEELWVEVSVPPTGPPRPIRLGVRKDGTLRPIEQLT